MRERRISEADYVDMGIFASVGAGSADGINHAYITNFGGGTFDSVTVPEGLFVGMENENVSHSDLNYNDEDILVEGATASAVTPEPASILLLGTGVVAFMGVRRRGLLR